MKYALLILAQDGGRTCVLFSFCLLTTSSTFQRPETFLVVLLFMFLRSCLVFCPCLHLCHASFPTTFVVAFTFMFMS